MPSYLSKVAVVIEPLLEYLRYEVNNDVIFLRDSPGKKSFILLLISYLQNISAGSKITDKLIKNIYSCNERK